jgi:hypothetical protein
MVIDISAIIAILLKEPEAALLADTEYEACGSPQGRQTLAVYKVEQFRGWTAGLLKPLLPLLHGGLADTQEGGEHRLAYLIAGADLLDVLGGKGPLGREAKRVEFPHGHSVQVARVVKSFSRLMDIVENSPHAQMTSTIKLFVS